MRFPAVGRQTATLKKRVKHMHEFGLSDGDIGNPRGLTRQRMQQIRTNADDDARQVFEGLSSVTPALISATEFDIVPGSQLLWNARGFTTTYSLARARAVAS